MNQRPIAQLAYLGFEVSDAPAWERFATEILGLMIGGRRSGGFDLRLDSRARRILVRKGPADDLNLVGWEAADPDGFSTLKERLSASGARVREIDRVDCAIRGVARGIAFIDPAGVECELVLGHESAASPFQSDLVRGGFVAEELGLGHVVVRGAAAGSSEKFYEKMLGFGLSDRICCNVYGFDVNLAFFHTNARHHSLAVGGALEKRMHHFMIEANNIDDVGRAYDRCLNAKVPIHSTLGRHPNDQMFSFYAETPSGFQFEFGCDGRTVDPEHHMARTYDRISDWGHHPPQRFAKR
jgi:2,3-dihydroxybiphenyl 1,2-dioxygenase